MQDLTTEEASRQPYEEVAARLQTDLRTGLSWPEADSRLKVFGANEFEGKEEEPLWRKYLEQVSCLRILVWLIIFINSFKIR